MAAGGSGDHSLQPYLYEPMAISSPASLNNDVGGDRRHLEGWVKENIWRTGNKDWCLCDHCHSMEIVEESMCCREIKSMWKLVENLEPQQDIKCLTLHPGFEASVLNPWALQLAYYSFCQAHGPLVMKKNENFRYCAYRQIVRWAHGVVGRTVRKPIPACVLNAIRKTYPNHEGSYKRFRWPELVNPFE
ncbi:unnamed protein product [Meganyctiphanes norvegica]|uniref:P2X purinoreceptor 7 intracellular domain-containing protein n=1 Tax=Meganyctiphanes norvegica TaxID=48144 RepID=A0AAV2RSY1_MEGNR